MQDTTQPLDEQAFRDRAYELALGQLAVVFAQFFGSIGVPARFESLATHRFMLEIAPVFAKFIDNTAVEALDESSRFLAKPSSMGARQVNIDHQRAALKKAGLRRIVLPATKGD